ncbi:MAG: hypothetical protein DBO99_02810 [gamma proteobacterium symbiont of Ctena orbiculata]|nr:MAG: hypothetical protein DBO99_02810 [gamma proteobacterium symbiont of Ctena orbiculata]
MGIIFKRTFILIITAMCSFDASSDEYFGRFLDKLKGVFISDAKPRPQFKTEQDFRFEDPNGLLWLTPSGTHVDGASIPQFFWSIIGGPFEGSYINASVIHDHYCRTKERTAHDTHRNFYYGMRASNVPEWKAELMHWAVSTFGPSWKLEKRVVMSQKCINIDVNTKKCKTTPTIKMITVSEPPVDLSNPEVLALAISKTNAIARTLLTSKGKVLDISQSGKIDANIASLEASAAKYRKLFKSDNLIMQTKSLGLLSQTSKTSLASIQPWENNKIPSYTETKVLTHQFSLERNSEMPFRIEAVSLDFILDNVDLHSVEANSHIQVHNK